MRLHLTWHDDYVVLHAFWRDADANGKRRDNYVQVRGSRRLGIAAPKDDTLAMFIKAMPRKAFNLSDLMADRTVFVRPDYKQMVIDLIDN